MYIHTQNQPSVSPQPTPKPRILKRYSLTRGKFCRFTWKPERFADYLAAGTKGRRVSRCSVWPYHLLSVGWDSNQHMALPTRPCGAGSLFYLPVSGVCSFSLYLQAPAGSPLLVHVRNIHSERKEPKCYVMKIRSITFIWDIDISGISHWDFLLGYVRHWPCLVRLVLEMLPFYLSSVFLVHLTWFVPDSSCSWTFIAYVWHEPTIRF